MIKDTIDYSQPDVDDVTISLSTNYDAISCKLHLLHISPYLHTGIVLKLVLCTG